MPLLIRIWQWALTEQLSSTTWVSNWGQGGWDCLGVWWGKPRFQWLSKKGIKHLLQKCTLGYYCNSCPRSVWHLIPSCWGLEPHPTHRQPVPPERSSAFSGSQFLPYQAPVWWPHVCLFFSISSAEQSWFVQGHQVRAWDSQDWAPAILMGHRLFQSCGCAPRAGPQPT